MKSELLALAPPSSESDWIDGELIRNLMRGAPETQITAALIIPVMFAVLQQSAVPMAGLGLWTVAMLMFSGLRFWVMRRYTQHVAHGDTDAQLKFMARYGWTWPLGACLWASAGLLFFDKTPLATQFLGWLIIVGIGTFAVTSLSNSIKTLRSYVSILVLTCVGVILWRIVVDLRFEAGAFYYWLLLLVGIHWLLLLRAGRGLYETHRSYVELQYRNGQLIESLTRQTQAALEAVAVKNRFLANAAHDIRQPVHALWLYADWLNNEPELVAEIAPRIVESTKAVNALFDSLFDLAKLDSGKTRVHVETVDVATLLRDMELQYRPLAKSKGLALRVRSARGLERVQSDRILRQRILGNLLGNALKYTDSGGVLVAARRAGQGVRVEVWDTGIGIASQYHAEVFREFYKVPNHPGTDDGFGLGLAIVARLSQRLGHGLSMNSQPGRGSVFKLTLQGRNGPLAQPFNMP
ncbi:MAG: HAMP domain-containing sensor histidine kinase [Rhodoferax sp.]|nr:HAMP domain-containing sensor histidine kinase [Rhodoferax sp.]